MLFLLLFGFSLSSYSAQSCSADELLEKTCQFYKEHEREEYIKTSNGQHFPNPLYGGKKEPHPNSGKDQIKRVEDLLKYAKNQIVDLIKMGRKDSQLSEEQKNLIKKVNTIKNVPPSDPQVHFWGKCTDEPDAFYMFDTHTITICKDFEHLPDSQIVSILGHEIGHAIGPCATENPLYKISQKQLEIIADGAYESDTDDADDIGEKKNSPYEQAIRDLSKFETEFTNIRHADDLKVEPYKALAKHKVYSVHAAAVPNKKHPFEHVRSCLVKNENVSELTDQDIKDEVNRPIEKKKLSGKSLEEHIAKLKKSRYCEGTSTKFPKIEEGMGDFYGSFVAARYTKEFPPKNQTDAMATVSLYSYAHCYGKNKPDIKAEDLAKQPHALAGDRLKSTYFKMPGIAETLGCEVKPKSKCFNNIEFLLKNSSAAEAMKSQQ